MKFKLYHISCLINILCCVVLITRLIYNQLTDAFSQNTFIIIGLFAMFVATFIKNIIGSSFKRYLDAQTIISIKKVNLFYVLRVAHMIGFLLIFAAQIQAWRSGMYSIDLSSINRIFFYSGTIFMISSLYTLAMDRPFVHKLRNMQRPEKFSFEKETKDHAEESI